MGHGWLRLLPIDLHDVGHAGNKVVHERLERAVAYVAPANEVAGDLGFGAPEEDGVFRLGVVAELRAGRRQPFVLQPLQLFPEFGHDFDGERDVHARDT